MKNSLKASLAMAVVTFVSQVSTFALSISDQTHSPFGTQYKQPEIGLLPATGFDLKNGYGEELTLSAQDPTTQLTDIYVKSSIQNSPGSGMDLTWTLNLYNITTGHELTETETGVDVTTGDYIDFTLSPTISAKADMIGGDTYAFTLTTTTTYFITDIQKNTESPKNYLPPGVTSEFAVYGNGSYKSLKKYTVGKGCYPVDVTYFLKTTCKPPNCAPEPGSMSLMLFGAAGLVAFARFRKGALV
jgi:hypothetical protein